MKNVGKSNHIKKFFFDRIVDWLLWYQKLEKFKLDGHEIQMCLILSFCSKCSFSSFVVEEKTYSLGNREMSRYVVLFCLTISSTLVHISFHFKFFLTFFFFPFLCRKSPLYIHELGLQIKVILFLLMLLPCVSSRSHFSSFLNWNWVQSQVMCLQGDVTFSIKL